MGICLRTAAALQNRDRRVVHLTGLLAMTRRLRFALHAKSDNTLSYFVITSDRRERGNLTCDIRCETGSLQTDF